MSIFKTAALLHNKKYRDKHKCFLVEGVRILEELLHSDWTVEAVFYNVDKNSDLRWQTLKSALLEKSASSYALTAKEFSKISETENSQGLIAMVKQKECIFADVIKDVNAPLLVVLDNVRDPGNMGTIIRTSAAVGVHGLVLCGDCVDRYNSKVVRSTMGAMFNIPIVTDVSAAELEEKISLNGWSCFCTKLDEEHSKSIWQTNFTGPVVFVFGNEGAGVSSELESICNGKIFIPQPGRVESLNVASAAAVVLYECLRQRIMR